MLKCINPLIHIKDGYLDEIKSLSFCEINKPYFYWNKLSNFSKKLVSLFISLNKATFINCRKCFVCLNYKRNDWIKRALIEKQNYLNCYFITLTFDNEHLKVPYFEKRFLSYFLKKVKKYYFNDFSYFASAEYGSRTFRKHYHLILFTNEFFNDLEYIKKTKKGTELYTSKSFANLWENGFISIALVSSQFVFNYVLKYSQKALYKKNSSLIPNGYLGEHLIISRGFGSNVYNLNLDFKNFPSSLVKNAKTRIYSANKKLKQWLITIDDFYKISNSNLYFLNYGDFKYRYYLNNVWKPYYLDFDNEAKKIKSNVNNFKAKGNIF